MNQFLNIQISLKLRLRHHLQNSEIILEANSIFQLMFLSILEIISNVMLYKTKIRVLMFSDQLKKS